jgi:excisionase family DNA binding protein
MVKTDLTTDDVAATLRLNKATVQRLLKTGRLTGYQIGRSWRVPVSALEAFRTQGENVARGRLAPVISNPVSVTEDFDQWERLLLAEEDLADAPAIPLAAMRRESLYEGRS